MGQTRHNRTRGDFMKKINFNTLTDEEFLGLEREAWNDVLDVGDFPAAEYKFFDTIRILGMRHRHDKIPKELLKDDILKARKIYKAECEKRDYGYNINARYQDAIMKSDALKIAVEKAATVEDKLRFALECVELLTNESGFAVRNLGKVGLL